MTEQQFWNLHHKVVYTPKHPNTSKRGQMLKCRLEVEKTLGRYLKLTEVIHHHYLKNGDVFFIICKNTKIHNYIHAHEEAFRYCGNPHWRKCKYCKQYDDPKNLTQPKSGSIYHKSCAADYDYFRKQQC